MNIVLFALSVALLACAETRPRAADTVEPDSSAQEIEKPETDVISERIVLVMHATAAQIDSLRVGRPEEDFYTIADDMNWYRAVAADYLEKKKLPVRDIEGVRPFAFMVDGAPRRYDFKDVQMLDVIVLYDANREPRVTSPVDIHQAVAEYFGIPAEPADTF